MQEPDWPSSDGKVRVVSQGEEWLGIVAGAEEYPWLAELLPRRPADATDCVKCEGQGRVPIKDSTGRSVVLYCGDCNALGWGFSEQAVQQGDEADKPARLE
jgi:hypothetical protein